MRRRSVLKGSVAALTAAIGISSASQSSDVEARWYRTRFVVVEEQGTEFRRADLAGHRQDIVGYGVIDAPLFGDAPLYAVQVVASAAVHDSLSSSLTPIDAPMDRLREAFDSGSIAANGQGVEW